MSKELASALRDTLISPNVSDANMEPANVVDVLAIGLKGMVVQMQAIGTHLKYLGTGDNGSPMGAIEFHGVCVKEAGENIAGAIRELAEAIAGCQSMGGPSWIRASSGRTSSDEATSSRNLTACAGGWA